MRPLGLNWTRMVRWMSGAAAVALVVTVWTTTRTSYTESPPRDPAPARSTNRLPAGHPPSGSEVATSFRAAVEQLDAELAAAPRDSARLIMIATLYHDAHKPAQAIPYYLRYLEIAPTDEQGWLDLAACYADIEDWTGAELSTRTLLALRPGHPEALYNLGAIEANRGDIDRAREIWSQLVEDGPDTVVTTRARASLANLARTID